MSLGWSLVVPTLNREECLLRSLRQNIRQTRPPVQVVVVDASDDWERVRDRVLREIAVEAPAIEWIYVGSDRRSLTHQRNIGLKHCKGDVAFLLDDDSFMYHDCAEELMRIYEADERKELGGVSAWLADAPEGSPASTKKGSSSIAGALMGFAERQWWQDKLFIPYDGRFHDGPGDNDETADVFRVPLFHGCRMTFRTEALRQSGGSEEMLVGTGYGEDCDLSYRVSRDKALVLSRRALLYHEQTMVQRPKRELNTSLIILNAIALYQLNHGDGANGGVAYGFLLKRLMLELFRDCVRPRRWMPHTRGALRAARLVPTVLSYKGEELRRRYVEIQQQLKDAG
jgi:GT2 family glycosyltransferase